MERVNRYAEFGNLNFGPADYRLNNRTTRFRRVSLPSALALTGGEIVLESYEGAGT
jgi:hypothetical protein